MENTMENSTDNLTYPESLPESSERTYWHESVFFGDDPTDNIHCYLHSNIAYDMHKHDFFEVNIVMNGKGRHYVENGSCYAVPGSVFVIPPKVRHGYFPMPSIDVFHILISRRFIFQHADVLRKINGFTALFEIEPMLRQSTKSSTEKTLSIIPALQGEKLEVLKNETDQLLRIQKMQNPDLNFVKNARAIVIIALVCECINTDMINRAPNLSANANAMIETLEYVHSCYSQKLTVNDLAQRAHMSRSSFIRVFEHLTGIAPYNYLMNYRMSKAKELLKMSNNQITEIAEMCGFYDSSHFNKYFTKVEGASPKEYREMFKDKKYPTAK